MQAAEAIRKMVPPAGPRPVWLKSIIQIMTTRACDLACVHCTQGSNLAGKPVIMDPADFERAVLSLKGFPGVIGCFGGNACLSPYFEDYCRILRAHVPFRQRGLWSNHPRGKGAVCRVTFNPAHSNLNCHMVNGAYEEFARDWPECVPYLRGMDRDSIHSAPFVAIKDVVSDEGAMWEQISKCDINAFWSACLGVVPGRGLRAYFCELAYAQAAIHATADDAEDWINTGMDPTPGWWRRPMQDFEAQVRRHCTACGVPLRRPGLPAVCGDREEFSQTHAAIARPKVKGRPVEIVETIGLVSRPERPSTQYLPGVTPGYHGH